jgi:hypothetical protein
MRILIQGDGAAACCCAHLLSNAGFVVSFQPVERSRVPAIMLSDAAVDLMRDVFHRPDLFQSARRITKRLASWGSAAPAEVEHSAVVVSEQAILNELRPRLNRPVENPDFTIYASRPVPGNLPEKCFGTRMARALPVELAPGSDAACCSIEALENGWLFLIPVEEKRAWLMAVGASVDDLLDASSLIVQRISSRDDAGVQFPSGPRVLTSLGGSNWLACGSAAMAFDPICGDGTAHAIREAILAAAVVRSIASGGNQHELLAHYQTRLLAGFQRHLAFCAGFYQSAFDSHWWQQETQALKDGLEWCARRMDQHPKFKFQLRGFELQPISGS